MKVVDFLWGPYPLVPGKVFDIFKVCSAGQFIAAFPITVILKKMRKRIELCPKFLGDWWIKKKYEALWNFFYIYGNAEERKWNLSKKKFYWTNAGFCEDLLWTRNSALFGLLDVQHFLFGRFLISKLEGNFFNWELKGKNLWFFCQSTSCVSPCLTEEFLQLKRVFDTNETRIPEK